MKLSILNLVPVREGQNYQQAMAAMAAQLGAAVQQQVSAAMGTAMGQLSSNMASAFSIDTSAFANAFQVNMSSNDLTDIMMSMRTTEERTYENNLKNFGYADLNNQATGFDIG